MEPAKRAYKPQKIVPPTDGMRRIPPPKGTRHIVLAEGHAAIQGSRTLFPHSVKFVEEVNRVLVDGYNSRKIGKMVTKGPWKGCPIYTLTLQERATCPTACAHWHDCYGNSMHWANRIVHDKDFEEILWLELESLQAKHPRGFVVRLHILGDFYSVAYVRLWAKALDAFPALNVFGYTARDPATDPIGEAVYRLSDQRFIRFAIRFSGKDWGLQGAITVAKGAKPPNAIVCPAQRGQTACCGTCGLCWTANRTIAFEQH